MKPRRRKTKAGARPRRRDARASAATAAPAAASPSARRIRVGILFGGRSVEHEISILSARAVAAALDPAKYEAVPIGIAKDGRWLVQDASLLRLPETDPRKLALDTRKRPVMLPPHPAAERALLPADGGRAPSTPLDVVFPVLHGTFGEDGAVQGLLELSGLPYVGSGVLGSALGMDKDVQKRVLREAGIPVTRFHTVRAFEWRSERRRLQTALAASFPPPCFVKPANSGSSVGIRRVKTAEELSAALDHALTFDEKALVEEMVWGREIECAVLGNDEPVASVPGEIVPRHEFYTYEAKYLDPDGAALKVPADLPREVVEKVQHFAVLAFRKLEMSGMARVDFFVVEEGRRIVVSEANTIPGFTAISMYPRLWQVSGLPFPKLVEALIELAVERHRTRGRLRTSLDAR